MKTVDKVYSSSSFLMFRSVIDKGKCFSDKITGYHYNPPTNRVLINNSFDLECALREKLDKGLNNKRAALALSGGIDSAILAKMVPKNSIAYTFRCIVPGVQVIDETPTAAKYAKECGLEHRIIDVYWEDLLEKSLILMLHKGSPVHSIEIQIYKAALKALEDSCDAFVFGESADVLYGGMSGLLSRDWTFGEFVDRYSYVLPYKVLKEYEMVTSPYIQFEHDGYIDAHAFMGNVFYEESINSYANACATAGIECIMPFSYTKMNMPLDYTRIRRGENKYLVREVFHRLYPGWEVPNKTPMPRPMNEWMKDWKGPVRPEFWPNCTSNMTGDQKWYVYSLESFLNLID